MRTRSVILSILCLAVIALSACSSGGGDQAATPPAEATTLNGMVSKGPIQSGTVTVFAIISGAVDTSAPIGQGQTDSDGNFSVDLGPNQGPVLLEVTGGSFTDEVSGLSVNLNAPLHTIVPDVPAGSITTVTATPLTELAFRRAKGGGELTAASIKSSNDSIATTFGLKDIVSTLPFPNGNTDDQKKYAAVCGAFSQLLNDNKGAGETLDDALVRLFGKMGSEMESGGKLSTDSTVMINGAITNFNASAGNVTGATVPTLFMPTAGVLTLATFGIPSVIFGIDVTIALPAGVIVDADPLTGEAAAGVVSISGVAAVTGSGLSVAKYTPASIGVPALLHIVMVNNLGFGLGEFVTIQFSTTTGATFPMTSQFFVTSFLAKGFDGAGLAGVIAAPAAIEGVL